MKRKEQLREAALNLGMNDNDAEFYAEQALAREREQIKVRDDANLDSQINAYYGGHSLY